MDIAGGLRYVLADRSLGGTLLRPMTEHSLCSPTHQIGGIIRLVGSLHKPWLTTQDLCSPESAVWITLFIKQLFIKLKSELLIIFCVFMFLFVWVLFGCFFFFFFSSTWKGQSFIFLVMPDKFWSALSLLPGTLSS